MHTTPGRVMMFDFVAPYELKSSKDNLAGSRRHLTRESTKKKENKKKKKKIARRWLMLRRDHANHCIRIEFFAPDLVLLCAIYCSGAFVVSRRSVT